MHSNSPTHRARVRLVGLAVGCLLALPVTMAQEQYSGDIRFFVDGVGRAALFVDSDTGAGPDGFVDEVFLLPRQSAIAETFSVSASGASVSYSGDRVVVTTTGAFDSGLLSGWLDTGTTCQAGGEGAKASSLSESTWSRSASCAPGYHACCNPPSGGGCKCYEN